MGDPSSNPLILVLQIILIIFLVLASAFFSLTETAFTCMNQFRMKIKADEGSKGAKLALKLHEKFDKTLISVLIGHNIVAIIVSAIATLLFINLFGGFIGEGWASIIETILMTIILYLFGDTIPKFIGKAYPDKVAIATAHISFFFIIIFKPLSLIFEGLTWLTNRILRTSDKPTLTEEEFTDIVESIEEDGLLEENESDIIQASLDFDDTKVKEVLTPVEKMYCLDIDKLTKENLIDIISETNYSRIPVYKGDIDHVVGILHVRSYLKAFINDRRISFRKNLQKPYIVSPKVTLDDLFDGFSKHKTHIAIVKNKGKVVGMVTMEDVLEELVGDINEFTPKLKKAKGGK